MKLKTQFKIVNGLPTRVEKEIEILLNDGWEFSGPMNSHKGATAYEIIFVQCMIKHTPVDSYSTYDD